VNSKFAKAAQDRILEPIEESKEPIPRKSGQLSEISYSLNSRERQERLDQMDFDQ
jgi:hypothetical protein